MDEQKQKTYEEKIEAAAEEYERKNDGYPYDDVVFRNAVQWCRENPPPEFVLRRDVEAMLKEFETELNLYPDDGEGLVF